MVAEFKSGYIKRLIPVAPLDAHLHGGGGCCAGHAPGTGTPVPRPRCPGALLGVGADQA